MLGRSVPRSNGPRGQCSSGRAQRGAARARPIARRRRGAPACEAFFKLPGLLGGGGAAAGAGAAGFSEKPAYSKREMLKIGDLDVSPMGMGTWSWGNRFLFDYSESMDPELQEVFDLVVSRGINLFDTADSYGTGRLNGRSEQLLGQFTREYPGSDRVRGGVHIATKLAAYPWRVTPGNMVAACKGSLRRLGADSLSLGQLHWSAAKYAPLQEWALWNGLADCYEQGLVRAVGVSNYGPQELRRVHKKFAGRGVPLASAQVQFSLLSYGPQQLELQETAAELGVTVISYSPLALGLLTGKYSPDNLPKGPRGALFKQLLPEIVPLLAALDVVAKSRRKTVSQVAINWCMCQGAGRGLPPTIPIPGAKSLDQARGNLGALGWRLSEGECRELEAAAARCSGRMVQNIFQTA
ncbi:MAG: NADP-dependent oxidoreductase domain-containing protein [Monoraphidium minutum]|nr:MAG: NADP-dependent oxidoreductase domain-containing protein [Monoraphidium minutum]